MRAVAVIPARGGSKRLPGKNLLPLCGKPLLAHSIEQAPQSGVVEEIIVSTDDEEIAALAELHDARVVRRPAALSGDDTPSEAALLHALDQLGGDPDLVVFLQCTSPIRQPAQIAEAVRLLHGRGWDSLFSATRSQALLWRQAPGGPEPLNYALDRRPRDQDHAEEYRENGSIYVMKPWVLRQLRNRLGGRIGIYEMPYWSSFQIDTEDDVALCEWILAHRQATSIPGGVHGK